MNKINIFCFGFGQVAEAFINKLINKNINFKLGITSRKDTHKIIGNRSFSDNKNIVNIEEYSNINSNNRNRINNQIAIFKSDQVFGPLGLVLTIIVEVVTNTSFSFWLSNLAV